MSPEDLLDHIGSRDDFLRFLDALLADHKGMERKQAEMPSSPYGPAAGGWENVRLGSFLEAMGAWARDADLSETASWRAFAQLLLAGKGYE